MKPRIGILLALLAGVVAGIALLATGGDQDSSAGADATTPGQPSVSVISPRNGARQTGKAVVVTVRVRNFTLSPRAFGGDPLLGEGHIRFALNRVPDCVDPRKLQRALESPLSSGRLIGRSLDYPQWSGPNGVLAERIGSAGLYSPATEPRIFYQRLPPGFYRMVVTLADNSGAPIPHHAVTNFEVLPDPRLPERPAPDCRGKVSSAEAAAEIR